jgi:hypothetical protein
MGARTACPDEEQSAVVYIEDLITVTANEVNARIGTGPPEFA